MDVALVRMALRSLLALGVLLALLGCSPQGGGTPGGESPKPHDAKSAYLTYCNGCHAAPQPGAYVARDWPAIVARMQQRRMGVGLGAIPPDTYQQILDYLQQNAADSGH